MEEREPLHETVPLTAEELQSLRRVSLVLDRMALPAAHIYKLLDGGYARGPRGIGGDGPGASAVALRARQAGINEVADVASYTSRRLAIPVRQFVG